MILLSNKVCSFEGVEPQLTLSTQDGALLAPHDPVTMLLGYSEVLGEVTNWKQHSVTQRYREACSQLNIGMNQSMLLDMRLCSPLLYVFTKF